MAWHYTSPAATVLISTGAIAMYDLITVIEAAGGTRVSDSDGTTYAPSGGAVTSGNSGAGGLNNTGAWVCWKMPDGREYVVQVTSAGDGAFYAKYSRAAGFVGGSPGATQVPAASDELLLGGSIGPDSSPSPITLFASPDGTFDCAVGASDVAPYPFYLVAWTYPGGYPNGAPCGCWLVDGIVNPGMAGDPDPFMSYWDGTGEGGSILSPGLTNDAGPVTISLNGAVVTNACAQTPIGHGGVYGVSPDFGNGKDQLTPIAIQALNESSPGAYGGVKGYCATFLWCVTGTTADPRYAASLKSVVTTADYLGVGGVVFPWDGSTPADSANGPYATELVFPLKFVVCPAMLPEPIPGAPGLPLNPTISPTLAALFQVLGNNYGVDVLCLTDLDPNFSLTQNSLPQDVWHLITEQPGTIFWSPNQTFSIRSMLSKGIIPSSLAAVDATIQSVIGGDDRVSQCQSTTTQTGPETVQIAIRVFPEQGSAFQLVAAIGKVSITLISVGLVNL